MGHLPIPQKQPIDRLGNFETTEHYATRKPSSTEANQRIVGPAQILKKEREKKVRAPAPTFRIFSILVALLYAWMSIDVETCHVSRRDTDVGSGIYRALDRVGSCCWVCFWPCLRAPGGGVPGFLAGLALVFCLVC